MRGPVRGFSLIELMIVIAVIAIIAAIAVPGILAAIRAANERNASASLKNLGSVEVAFRTADGDQNGMNDYWTADVAGLRYLIPTGASQSIQMIELPVALADGNTDVTNQATTYAPPDPAHVASPKSGYWFMAQAGYENTAGAQMDYGRRHTEKFSFVGFPSTYGSTGRLMFATSEAGTQYKMDPGSTNNVYGIQPPGPPPKKGDPPPPPSGAAPVVGASDTEGVLGVSFQTFPNNPLGPATSLCAGPWSKMD